MSIPPSPGGKRKGKTLPKLPLSAFSPPNSGRISSLDRSTRYTDNQRKGTSEKFPLPPSPSTVQPESVLDANVVASNGDALLSRWKIDAGPQLGSRIGGIVVSLSNTNEESLSKYVFLYASRLIHLTSLQIGRSNSVSNGPLQLGKHRSTFTAHVLSCLFDNGLFPIESQLGRKS